MDDVEAKVRCLELAERLSIPDRSVNAVVQIATSLYSFVQASPQDQPLAEIVDKPRKGRPPKASILD